MPKPLDSPWAKADRAFEHAKALESATQAFLDQPPYDVAVEQQPDGWHIASFRVREGIPIRFDAIVGDIIENLRAARVVRVQPGRRVGGSRAS